jgi:hypothetical protein
MHMELIRRWRMLLALPLGVAALIVLGAGASAGASSLPKPGVGGYPAPGATMLSSVQPLASGPFFWAPYGGSNFINETPHLHELTLTANGTDGTWETVAVGTNGGSEVYLFEDTQDGLCANEPGGGYGDEIVATSCVSSDQNEQFYDFDANGEGSWLINIAATISTGDTEYVYMTAIGSPCTAGETLVAGAAPGAGNCAVWDHYAA